MEPERDIEKELKAYTEKRRAAAGSPPPLHPANRKALQAEAARLAKSTDAPARSWWQTFLGSWPGLAVTAVTVVAVVIATSHLLTPPENRHERAQSFAASRPSAPAPMEAPALRAERPAGNSGVEAKPAASVAVNNAVKRVPETVPANIPAASALPPPPSLAETGLAPAPAATPAPGAAPPSVSTLALNQPVSRDRASVSSSGQLDKDSGAAPPAATATGGGIAGTPGSFDRLLVTADRSSALVTQRFRRTEPSAKATKALNISNILASFKVEQDLGKLRIIDGDGSVYLGSVEQAPEAPKRAEAAFEEKISQKETAQTKSARPMQAFHFRVSGTNRTLKQEVVFTGSFLTAAALQPAAPTNINDGVTFGAAPPAAAVQPVLFELRKARLEGQLLLGTTNKLEIKAAPVKR